LNEYLAAYALAKEKGEHIKDKIRRNNNN